MGRPEGRSPLTVLDGCVAGHFRDEVILTQQRARGIGGAATTGCRTKGLATWRAISLGHLGGLLTVYSYSSERDQPGVSANGWC